MRAQSPTAFLTYSFILISSIAWSTGAQAKLPQRSLCVWDPVGASGPMFTVIKTAKPAALKMGVALKLLAYTDEKVAAEDFKAGQCDSVLLTGTRAREFNRFTGTLEALGALPSDDEMKMVINTLKNPKAAKLLIHGNYEVAGIIPSGAVYLFTRDRNINTVEKIQGKKVATFDYDRAAMFMGRHVGASPVPASTATFSGLFNNGSVDMMYSPAVAYAPLELYRGLGDNGGVINFKLAQMSFQVIIQRSRFPQHFGQEFREYIASHYDEFYELTRTAEADINKKYWVELSSEDMSGYMKMFREVRIGLRDEGVYDARALRLMRKIRCKKDPTHAECIEKTE